MVIIVLCDHEMLHNGSVHGPHLFTLCVTRLGTLLGNCSLACYYHSFMLMTQKIYIIH